MELLQAFEDIQKNLENVNKDLGFSRKSQDESSITFKGEKGIYRLNYDSEIGVIMLDVAYDDNGEQTEYNTVSKSLF